MITLSSIVLPCRRFVYLASLIWPWTVSHFDWNAEFDFLGLLYISQWARKLPSQLVDFCADGMPAR